MRKIAIPRIQSTHAKTRSILQKKPKRGSKRAMNSITSYNEMKIWVMNEDADGNFSLQVKRNVFMGYIDNNKQPCNLDIDECDGKNDNSINYTSFIQID